MTVVCQQLYNAVRAADRYGLRLRFPTTPSKNSHLHDLNECSIMLSHIFVTVCRLCECSKRAFIMVLWRIYIMMYIYVKCYMLHRQVLPINKWFALICMN